ncbi:RnfH family protein [Pseudomaricurvus alkylphenolicus]|jgi:putative ubiquitin-RnfH superfamily antitoxin RatB of RatAB toxin-antitoxin module|uniref:RnfH family protein n=1 Tax=Pseudomaricurvus alkylphenolicus TaxID=1306991 RepID=UPI0014247B22|nr:RnfH family protein [Pseudomaricurvus alkylphenolicus]NIB44613.1 RnfH family protein [Pseudomaricurvus alkylphenolicus]
MSDIEMITVEVAYALPHKQKIVELLVKPGTTALQAVQRSGLDKEFEGLDLETAKLGIFGQALGTKGLKKANEHILQAGDRVEIYRPLISDPKEVRRKRAEKAKQAAQG